MSYTLRGRIDSRLAALLPLLVVAVALHRWWPIELVALMGGVGVALDLEVYDRVLDYQPAWLAVPLGLLELGILMTIVRLVPVRAPLGPALGLFAAGWLVAQLLGHVALPLLRLGYAQDGGELGRAGVVLTATVAALLVSLGGFAYAQRPPVVHLRAGVHRGPLVIRRREILQGDPGAVVRGGIVVAANGVTIRDVTVVGGENGIVVDGVRGTRLERVAVSRARLDGIHVRRAAVTIRDCSVDMLGNPNGQGIDVSYNADKGATTIEGCSVVGGLEGIVVHSSNAMLSRNTVTRTTLHGIAVTEMSMGTVDRNEVRDARGDGIVCNDHSMCMVERNVVVDTRPAPGGDLWAAGYGFLASYFAEAELRGNSFVGGARGAAAVDNATVARR
jgi:parallel beta-helix repeat protein